MVSVAPEIVIYDKIMDQVHGLEQDEASSPSRFIWLHPPTLSSLLHLPSYSSVRQPQEKDIGSALQVERSLYSTNCKTPIGGLANKQVSQNFPNIMKLQLMKTLTGAENVSTTWNICNIRLWSRGISGIEEMKSLTTNVAARMSLWQFMPYSNNINYQRCDYIICLLSAHMIEKEAW